MFSLDDTRPETFLGDIGQLLKKIDRISNHTNEKKSLVILLKEVCSKNSYIYFRGFSHNFHISHIGGSYIYEVPQKKRGNLHQFQGKTIRLICVGSGPRWVRWYVAGIYKI